MYCSKCGNKISDDSSFCSNCGVNVSAEKNIESAENKGLSVNAFRFLTVGITIIFSSIIIALSSLVPYVLAVVKMDFSTYRFECIFYVVIFFIALTAFWFFSKEKLNKQEYLSKNHILLVQNLSLNVFSTIVIVFNVFFYWFSIFSKREITNAQLNIIGIVALIISTLIFLKIKKLIKKAKQIDKAMLFVSIVTISKEFVINFAILIGVTMLVSILPSNIIFIIPILYVHFIYPVSKRKSSKDILKRIFKVD